MYILNILKIFNMLYSKNNEKFVDWLQNSIKINSKYY